MIRRALPLVFLLLSLTLPSSPSPAQAPAVRLPGLAEEHSAADAWHKLRKLGTTASAMHTTAHPDDEHGGVLALLSRRDGTHVSLLSLTRGESGDNALGPELFDALGLIRTEELLLAGRYYGLDAQYFTTAVDYGFSKRLDEALEKWGPDEVLRDMVAVIRTERPLVIVSRFQGNARDGHGQHQAAGLLTRQAFEVAGDPAKYPEQIAGGLRPWQPLKLYMGGVREAEDWTLSVDAGQYDAVIGASYATLGRLGLSVQRSQTGGRFNAEPGPSVSYYKRLASLVDAPDREESFFDGIDTSIPALYSMLRAPEPSGARALLERIDGEIRAAVRAFSFTDPSAAAPALARALQATRDAAGRLRENPDVAMALARKERQIAEAMHATLGLLLTATAQPPGTPEGVGPFSPGPPPMGPAVPGQVFDVRTTFTSRGPVSLASTRVTVESRETGGGWRITGAPAERTAQPNTPIATTFSVTVPQNAPPTRPHFSRRSIQEALYTVSDGAPFHRPSAPAPLEAVARYTLGGVMFELRRPLTIIESTAPFGQNVWPLTVVPAIAISLSPARAVAPLNAASRTVKLTAEVLNNVSGTSEGTLRLEVPEGWKVTPASHAFVFSRAGERGSFGFDISMPALEDRDYRIESVASTAGREYREGYSTIRHRDLETKYLYRDAVASVRGIDVVVAPRLKVGYVMGVGDDVPAGLAQLGVEVHLLTEGDLATGDLAPFDAIMTGTRAYAVREDLKTYNRRLLDYVRDGGNLIVLYNTQEFVPDLHAPYPGALPRTAEEVSEEDSPVEILVPGHPVFTTPNRITQADFAGWVEQRGSKFWTAWDSRYTPPLATWDTGQAPQQGGWLHARYGKGHYTYFAYAFHRQLPYGVPGAYRLLANLLSLQR